MSLLYKFNNNRTHILTAVTGQCVVTDWTVNKAIWISWMNSVFSFNPVVLFLFVHSPCLNKASLLKPDSSLTLFTPEPFNKVHLNSLLLFGQSLLAGLISIKTQVSIKTVHTAAVKILFSIKLNTSHQLRSLSGPSYNNNKSLDIRNQKSSTGSRLHNRTNNILIMF